MTPTPGPSVADSVRLALPAEAATIAAVQRRGWSAQLPPEASEALLSGIGSDEMTAAWSSAILRPPKAQFRVLVAVEEHRVVGFATTAPSSDPDAETADDGMVDELTIDPPAQRRGHGSRLLNACVDTLRADGFSRATCWVPSTADTLRAFLRSAGWEPDGGWREIGPDEGSLRLRQVRLHTDIRDVG